MKSPKEKLSAEAQTSGFRPEVLEKVIHLLNLLEWFQSHPFLKGPLALRGGTAYVVATAGRLRGRPCGHFTGIEFY